MSDNTKTFYALESKEHPNSFFCIRKSYDAMPAAMQQLYSYWRGSQSKSAPEDTKTMDAWMTGKRKVKVTVEYL